jgi:hypothetical protein
MTDLVHWTAGAPLTQPWLPIAGERLLRVSDLGPFDLLDQRHEDERKRARRSGTRGETT